MITVERASEDGLGSRQWVFSTTGGHGGTYLTLTRYTEGKRETRRHKLKGEFWDAMDERHYHSKLPRPASIPEDVIDEAVRQMTVKVSIGWVTDKHVVATRRITRATQPKE